MESGFISLFYSISKMGGFKDLVYKLYMVYKTLIFSIKTLYVVYKNTNYHINPYKNMYKILYRNIDMYRYNIEYYPYIYI